MADESAKRAGELFDAAKARSDAGEEQAALAGRKRSSMNGGRRIIQRREPRI